VFQQQGQKKSITMPELIAQSYIRNPYPLEVKGGSFKSLG
jgi:hypothetical protein